MTILKMILGFALTVPMLISCGNERSLTSNAPTQATHNLVSETSAQQSVLYPKSRRQLRLEALLAKEKDRLAKLYAKSNAKKTIATKPALIVKTTVVAKDTITTRPKVIVIKADSVTSPQPLINQGKMAAYLRTPSDLKKFNVVVGTFSTLEKAGIMVQTILKTGFKPVIVPNGNGAYRVIASSHDSRDAADVDELSLELDSIPCWIWTQIRK